jgi:hypothetical protein
MSNRWSGGNLGFGLVATSVDEPRRHPGGIMTKNSYTESEPASAQSSEQRGQSGDGIPRETSNDIDDQRDQTRAQPRRPSLRIARLVGWLLLGGLVFAVAWSALWTLGRSRDSRTEAFSAPIDRLVVEDVNGRVSLEAGTATELTVEREWLFGGAPVVEMVEADGTLRISADCGAFCRTHVTGVAPANAELVVRTGAGDIVVRDFEGGVDLNTSAGDVTVSSISGPAVLRSDAGFIHGDVSDGDVDAQTSAGGIDLDVLGGFSRISAVSNAGSVVLTVPDDVYRVDAGTSAGSTEVDVADDPDATRVIIAHSDAGNVTVDRFPG